MKVFPGLWSFFSSSTALETESDPVLNPFTKLLPYWILPIDTIQQGDGA